MPNPYTFMNARLRLANRDEVLAAIDTAKSDSKVTIATVNAEFLVAAQRNTMFNDALSSMTHCTVDGSGPFMALKFWTMLHGEPAFDLYPGADMIADLFSRYQDGSKTFYLIGGKPGYARAAAETIAQKYPGCRILGAEDGGVIDSNQVSIDPELAERINSCRPDILLVGFGAPKQELWIQKAQTSLHVPTMAGIGGALGFYVDKKRAGTLTRALHLEWLSRMVREPGHWRRVLRAVIVFPLQAAWWMVTKG